MEFSKVSKVFNTNPYYGDEGYVEEFSKTWETLENSVVLVRPAKTIEVSQVSQVSDNSSI